MRARRLLRRTGATRPRFRGRCCRLCSIRAAAQARPSRSWKRINRRGIAVQPAGNRAGLLRRCAVRISLASTSGRAGQAVRQAGPARGLALSSRLVLGSPGRSPRPLAAPAARWNVRSAACARCAGGCLGRQWLTLHACLFARVPALRVPAALSSLAFRP